MHLDHPNRCSSIGVSLGDGFSGPNFDMLGEAILIFVFPIVQSRHGCKAQSEAQNCGRCGVLPFQKALATHELDYAAMLESYAMALCASRMCSRGSGPQAGMWDLRKGAEQAAVSGARMPWPRYPDFESRFRKQFVRSFDCPFDRSTSINLI